MAAVSVSGGNALGLVEFAPLPRKGCANQSPCFRWSSTPSFPDASLQKGSRSFRDFRTRAHLFYTGDTYTRFTIQYTPILVLDVV